MTHSKTDTRSAGFTLAEMLAVVIIIGILSALSLGYYKKSVEQSRFGEGLAAATMVAEAIGRARLDESIEGVNSAGTRTFKSLDVSLKNCGDTCCDTHYFKVCIDGDSATATANSGAYVITVTPGLAETADSITCTGSTDEGQALCEVMGY